LGQINTETVEAALEKLQDFARDSITFRLLDVLLTHASTAEGLGVIAGDIIDATIEPDGFDQLAEFYKTGLLIPI